MTRSKRLRAFASPLDPSWCPSIGDRVYMPPKTHVAAAEVLVVMRPWLRVRYWFGAPGRKRSFQRIYHLRDLRPVR